MLRKGAVALAVVALAACAGCATSAVERNSDSGGDAAVRAAPATVDAPSHRCEPLDGGVYNQAAGMCVPDGF